ncbi:hypothetical protein ACLIJ0_21375 [Enterobacter hormaechei]|uniref:hypothetical protein n=1 Tax=Enterobacter hormaechei TaxID=158836 RepID=UPI002075AF92|nr:hypothetical protein [Enterobacter hormaechei]
MKLPKHAPESTLINSEELHFEYNKTGSRERKIIQYQLIKNINPALNYLKNLLLPELSQNLPAAFQLIYPPTHRVYIKPNQTAEMRAHNYL